MGGESRKEGKRGSPGHNEWWRPFLGARKKQDPVAGTFATSRTLLSAATQNLCQGCAAVPVHCHDHHHHHHCCPIGHTGGGHGEDLHCSRSQKGPGRDECARYQVLLFPSAQLWPSPLIKGRAISVPSHPRTVLHLQYIPAAYTSSWPMHHKQGCIGTGISCGYSWKVPPGDWGICLGPQVMLFHQRVSSGPGQLPHAPVGTCRKHPQLMYTQSCFQRVAWELV